MKSTIEDWLETYVFLKVNYNLNLMLLLTLFIDSNKIKK